RTSGSRRTPWSASGSSTACWAPPITRRRRSEMALDSMQEIFDKIQAGDKPFWQVVRDTDMEERQVTAEASFEKMRSTWRAMVESVDAYRADRRSVSGLV